jgi:hypothetical protein
MKRFVLIILVLAPILSWAATAQSGNASVPKSIQDVLDAITNLQKSVDSLQTTVNKMPGAWYQILPSAQRFLLVMGGKAVLDRETGLVWEQSPSGDKKDW